ncbi:DUF4376 domain-containing protein [Marinobacter sp. 71-i]|uniref:DUF4376 domain-containing protein n=1 Tax=Marinobacter iranensis TaxID=2962607 RepID=A0ABT5Y9C9_9GAMM|nr:DUF4376 domain-containing protein [Marinobacter iranensis]MDF0750277.1 DUF4376 domain-containing protein [Marinobacter iranensis]
MKRFFQLNPDNRPATWATIKQWRDTHEVAPVDTTFGNFDCDERSDARMNGSIGLFDNLPTLQGGKLTWKRGDNSFIQLTKAELQQVYSEVQLNRATRGALLHVKAEMFRQMDPAPTSAQLSDLSFWLEE